MSILKSTAWFISTYIFGMQLFNPIDLPKHKKSLAFVVARLYNTIKCQTTPP